MNAVTQRAASASAVASLQHLKTGLQNVASHIPASATDPFLRMGTDGVWVYGQENIEVEEGSLWAVNPLSLMHGFCSWTNYPANERKSNEKLGEVMVPMTSPLPDRNQLPETGWAWTEQLALQLQCLSGEDKGEQVVYPTTSKGGMNAMRTLISAIMAQLDVDPSKPVPVVVLENDHYQHKKYGKTYTPIFTIKRWVEMSDVAPDVEAENEQVRDAAVNTAAAEKPADDEAPRSRSRGSVPQAGGQAEPQQEAAGQSDAPAADQPRRRRRNR